MPRLHALIAGLGAVAVMGVPTLGTPAAERPANVLALGLSALHPHPSGSTDRVTPGAVRVESSSHVSITLLDDRSVIQQVVREYDTDLAEGSGFTVTPDGVVVTATQVVQAASDPRIYAANRVFAEYFKVKIPADFKRHTLKDADLDRRLQACYPPQRADSTCISSVTTKVTVYPYLDPPPADGLPAQILTAGTSPAAAAVIKVTRGGEKQTLPTAPLGTSIATTVESLDVMSLPSRPSAKQPPKLDTAHLDPPGSRTFKETERTKLDGILANGGPGAGLIDDGRSEIVGLVSGGGDVPTTITPADDIRTALVTAGVTPRRGPVDAVFENALASFHNKRYSDAVPVLQQVLNLRPDHAVALDHLRVSRAKAGTAEDAGARPRATGAPVAASSTRSPLVWVAGGVVVIALAAAVAVPLLRRRRGRGADGAGPGRAEQPPVESWPPHAVTQVFQAPGESQRAADEARTPAPSSSSGAAASGAAGSLGAFGSPGADSYPPISHPSGPHASGPHPSGPHPSGPHPSGPHASGPASPPYGQPRPADLSPPRGQAQMQFCTQCGMRLGQGHRFCGFCGNPADV
ncbi:hypothetical protein JOL79_02015 [Microbispora sp. RL4-1S]|uniref:Uncharacterized protein n=1 Tax=Microbispora oryzae TaxID=2806554 RepID=A0A940WK10_9ACTN|nr:zinc ribbon domain-containing protein [Microbispora oryzae]MBP2702576.1 hypothetical protein [Microbispora oryzae]